MKGKEVTKEEGEVEMGDGIVDNVSLTTHHADDLRSIRSPPD